MSIFRNLIFQLCTLNKCVTSHPDLQDTNSKSSQESLPILPPQPIVSPIPPANQQTTALPADLLATDSHLWRIYDPDAWRENPVEIKHRKLLRSQRLGDEGKDLKPSPADRDRLSVSYITGRLSQLVPGDFPIPSHRLFVRSRQRSTLEVSFLALPFTSIPYQVSQVCHLV